MTASLDSRAFQIVKAVSVKTCGFFSLSHARGRGRNLETSWMQTNLMDANLRGGRLGDNLINQTISELQELQFLKGNGKPQKT